MQTLSTALAANTVSDVTLDGEYTDVEIIYTAPPGAGTPAPVYASVDGSEPSAAAAGEFQRDDKPGKGSHTVLPFVGARTRTVVPTAGRSRVRLLSATGCTVSVVGVGVGH